MLAFWCLAVGYAAGRTDRADLGPLRWRRRWRHLDSGTVARLQALQARTARHNKAREKAPQ